MLKRKSVRAARQSADYAALASVCAAGPLRAQCTTNRAGRTLTRHLRQAVLDHMRALAHSAAARRDLQTRQHLMERSFARATRYGFDRARWRGRWRVQIHEYLVCALQNIQIFLRYGRDQTKRGTVAIRVPEAGGVDAVVRFTDSASWGRLRTDVSGLA